MVAGGSLRAIEAILRGDVEHAFHPGGGLHHAMPDRASGFCIYDDPALAIARARRDGLRVLYVDLDVHHGDGVQAIHWDDPGVLTLSFHETGRYLFPGTGGVGELGEGSAAGTVGQRAARSRGPARARGWRPSGRCSPSWPPRSGRTSIVSPARRRFARLGSARAPAGDDDRDGRGGPAGRRDRASVRRRPLAGDRRRRLRRVPGRAADRGASSGWPGAHREVPDATPAAWRERWAAEAARYGQAPLPETFVDAPNAGMPLDASQTAAEAHSTETAALVRRLVVPAAAARGARPRLVGSAREAAGPSAPDAADGTAAPTARRRSSRRSTRRPGPA